MEKKTGQITITTQELLYYGFFIILLFAKGIGLYEGMFSFRVAVLAALACMAGAMLLTKYTIQEWVGIVLGLACAYVAYRNSGEMAAIITVLVIIGMKNIPLERVMKIAFVIWTITFYGMLIVHLVGWKEEIVLAHNKFGLGFLLRHSLGFPHPNVLHISFVIWMALLLYVCRFSHKQLIKVSVLLAIENVFIFLFSVSITGLALGFMYLVLNYYFYVRRNLVLAERMAIRVVLPLCILVSIIPPLLFQGRLFDILNKLLNTRMNIWKYYLTTFTPGLLGTRVYSPESGVMSLDCSYLYLLYYYGILLFIAIMGLMYWTMNRYIKAGKKAELAIILGMLVAGIVEPYLFNFSFKNLILLFMGHELFAVLGEKGKKEIGILRLPSNELAFNLPIGSDESRNRAVNTKQRVIKYAAVAAIVMGMAAGAYTAITYEKPETIYVQNHRCDYVKGLGILREEIENPDNCLILGYQNEETRFYGFQGNIITLEYIRGIIINIIFGACIGGIIPMVMCRNKEKVIKTGNK